MQFTIKFGRYDGNAVRYSSEPPFEAWWYVDGRGWLDLNHADAMHNAKVMTEAEYLRMFPDLSPLPEEAFTPTTLMTGPVIV
jgi:hypothetical protein